MAKDERVVASVSNVFEVFLQNSASTTGAGLTGLVFNSASLTAYYKRDDGTAAVAITLANITTFGTFANNGFREIDATNMPGLYEFDPPNAAFNSGAKAVVFMLKGATNLAPGLLEIALKAVDTQNATTMGLSALPNAAANASGGLFTRGTGAGQINQQTNGQIDVNLEKWINTAPLALSSQQVQAVVPAATVIATVTGNIGGNVNGSVLGNLAGNVNGSVLGNIAGNVNGNVLGTVANVAGNVNGSVLGNLAGNVNGNVLGTVANVAGNVNGNVLGTVANVAGNVNGSVLGNLAGNVNGSVLGSVTGNIGGNVNGSVLGNLAGNVNGSVLGNVTGSVGSVTAPVSIAASQLFIKKNTAYATFKFVMTDSTTHAPATGLTVTATRAIDNGAFGACANAVSELSSGWYKISFDATDLNGTDIAVRFTAATADDKNFKIVTQT